MRLVRRASGLAVGVFTLAACGRDVPTGPSEPQSQTVNGVAVTLLGASPAAGSTILVEACDPHCASATFRYVPAAPGERLLATAALLDASGAPCTFPDEQDDAWIEADQATTFTVRVRMRLSGGQGSCAFEARPPGERPLRQSAFIELRLLGQGRSPARLRFDLPYTLAAPALSSQPTAPQVTAVGWSWTGVGMDYLEPSCNVRDDDGDAVTMVLRLETEACRARGDCWEVIRQFAARDQAVDLSLRGRLPYYIDDGVKFRGEVICRAEDARGLQGRASVPICVDGPTSGECRP